MGLAWSDGVYATRITRPGPPRGLPQVSQTPTVLASARVPRDHLGSAPGARVGLAALSEPGGVPSGPECQSAARGQVSADPASYLFNKDSGSIYVAQRDAQPFALCAGEPRSAGPSPPLGFGLRATCRRPPLVPVCRSGNVGRPGISKAPGRS
eukprot:scaffold10143_cov120-Isochrysis_galbana.AAC.6